ncbi:hypothetical protein RJT34_30754 [Clitoria ternatea]|uniref:Uncharacterized protein n=1 Tax=Clitoria ternatea TaxID=43366 RepID=A0AAN9I2Y1_CLITE
MESDFVVALDCIIYLTEKDQDDKRKSMSPSCSKTHQLRHRMLLISARTLTSLYKMGLSSSLVCKNLYDQSTPIQLVPQIQDMLTQLAQFPFERPIHHNLPLLELPWSRKN